LAVFFLTHFMQILTMSVEAIHPRRFRYTSAYEFQSSFNISGKSGSPWNGNDPAAGRPASDDVDE
jgi:hypothetical protein